MSIADAMIYIIGIDSQFRYNEEYKKFLNAFKNKVNLDLNAYMDICLESILILENIRIL